MKKVLQNSIEKSLLEIIKLQDLHKLDRYLSFINETFEEEESQLIIANVASLLSQKFKELYDWFIKELKTFLDINNSIPDIMHLFIDEEYEPGKDFLLDESGFLVTEKVFKVLTEFYDPKLLEEFIEVGDFHV